MTLINQYVSLLNQDITILREPYIPSLSFVNNIEYKQKGI